MYRLWNATFQFQDSPAPFAPRTGAAVNGPDGGAGVPSRTGGSAERTLQLIQLLAGDGRAMSLAQLADRLDLPKATVHRLCARLVDMRFLTRDLDERRYVVGPALQRLAFDTLTHGTCSRLRHQVLDDLVAGIGETCNFTTLDGTAVLYLDRVEAERPWRLTLSVGAHVPIHCTASGKLFLSHLEPAERRRLIDHLDLRPLTGNTIVSAHELDVGALEIVANGYALEIEEFIAGLIALAVPVRDRTGKVCAAIAVHCPTSHAGRDEVQAHLPALQAAASRMGELLDV